MQRWRKWFRRERGQSLVIMTMAAVVLLAMTGLAIDVGRMFVVRAQLQRAVDAAALAGVQSFPDVARAVSDAQQYVAINEPEAIPSANQVGSDRKLRVSATQPVDMLFLPVLGITSYTVQASAVAGFSGVLDVALVIDNTLSMYDDPIEDAKDASNLLVSMLLPDTSGQTKVGLAPYRSCYSPPGTSKNKPGDLYGYGAFLQNCIPTSKVVPLTTNDSTLRNTINGLTASGYTNICMGLWQGKNVITGAGSRNDPKTVRTLVLLSDGDNNPHERSYAKWASACDPGDDSQLNGTSCEGADPHEAALDRKTYDMAKSLKALGVEIYVIGLSVCGSSGPAPCDSTAIGQGHDNSQDRNMLKCVASSSPGTNDHYYETSDSNELRSIFQRIGGAIITRLVE